MKKSYPYLNNPYYTSLNAKNEQELFLQQIDNFVNQRQYVKIILLDWNENPLKEIQGELSGGTINKDGSSSIRRSGSFSAVFSAFKYDIVSLQSDFSINKKIFVEIGIKNETNAFKEYPILWFPQGVFFISDFSCNVSAGQTISANISLKDKMMMLNGEIGGLFNSTTILDEMDTIDENTGAPVTKKVLIYNLIQELVNHFGGELLENIVVEDIPKRIKSIMKWTGDSPLYLIPLFSKDGTYEYLPQLEKPADSSPFLQFNYGEDVGYIYSDFVYDMELIANAGESVCSILDKIKQYLGNYEYFYDEYGIFHFKEIKNYLNTTQATEVLKDMELNEDDYLVDISTDKNSYTFSDKTNLISLNVTPQYGNIKNDYVVQGLRKSTGSDVSYPIYYHLAIDKKPSLGNVYTNVLFYSDSEDSSIIKAAFPNNDYYSSEFSNFYNKKETEFLKGTDFQNVLLNNKLKTLETLIEKESVKTGDKIYHTVKKEIAEVIDQKGDDLIGYLKNQNLITDLTADLSYEDYQQNHEVIFNYLSKYSNIKLEPYSRVKEAELKESVSLLFNSRNKKDLDIFKGIFDFYLNAALMGRYGFKKIHQLIFELFLTYADKIDGSFDKVDSYPLIYGNTFLLKDNNPEIEGATNLIHFYEKIEEEDLLQNNPKNFKRIFRKDLNNTILDFESSSKILQDKIDKKINQIETLKNKETLSEADKILLDEYEDQLHKLADQVNRDIDLASIEQKTSENSFYGMVQDIVNYSSAEQWSKEIIQDYGAQEDQIREDISILENIINPKKKIEERQVEINQEIDELDKTINELREMIQYSQNDFEKFTLEAQLADLSTIKENLEEEYQELEADKEKEFSEEEKNAQNNAKETKGEKEATLKELLKEKDFWEKELKRFQEKKDEFINKLLLALEKTFMNPTFQNLKYSYEVPVELPYLKEIYVFWNGTEYQEVFFREYRSKYEPIDWRTELYMQGMSAKHLATDKNTKRYSTDANFYFEELEAYWPTVYSLIDNQFYGEKENNKRAALCDGNYFLDFIEPSSKMGEFCVSNIGRRQNVTCDDKVNCLFSPGVPDIVLIDINDEKFNEKIEECKNNNQNYVQVSSEIYWALSLGGYKNPAFDQIKYDLYLHTNYQKTISFNARPVFYLEPNTRVTIKDYVTNTFGNFMLKNISISLGSNGTMSSSANEIFERF